MFSAFNRRPSGQQLVDSRPLDQRPSADCGGTKKLIDSFVGANFALAAFVIATGQGWLIINRTKSEILAKRCVSVSVCVKLV